MNIIMPIVCTLFVVMLAMGAGGYIVYRYKEKFSEYAFIDYEIEDDDEYSEWVDCEDESDNLYI